VRVMLERSGGIANIRRSVTVEMASLAPERAAELRALVDACGLATFPENPTPLAGKPDRFVFHLTVEDEAGSRAVTVSEDAASEEMLRLFDWLQHTAEG